MTKLNRSPPRPQPKHFQLSRAGVTVNEGVFSPWNGHSPLYDAPALRSCTVSPIRSTRLIFCLISAAAPTDVGVTSDCASRLQETAVHGEVRLVPDTRMALSRLDKASGRQILPLDKGLDKPRRGTGAARLNRSLSALRRLVRCRMMRAYRTFDTSRMTSMRTRLNSSKPCRQSALPSARSEQ